MRVGADAAMLLHCAPTPEGAAMSKEAVEWLLGKATGVAPQHMSLMFVLAWNADETGRGLRPATVPELAASTRKSERQTQRDLGDLAVAGKIRPGDLSVTESVRGDRRPRVWDLEMAFADEARSGLRGDIHVTPSSSPEDPHGVTSTSPREGSRGDAHVTPQEGGPDGHGVTPMTPRGDIHVTPSKLAPSSKKNPPPTEGGKRGPVADATGTSTPKTKPRKPRKAPAKPARKPRALTPEQQQRDELARTICTGYFDWRNAQGRPVLRYGKGNSPYLAAVNLVVGALVGGYDRTEIGHALKRSDANGNAVPTGQEWERLLGEVRGTLQRQRRGAITTPAERAQRADEARHIDAVADATGASVVDVAQAAMVARLRGGRRQNTTAAASADTTRVASVRVIDPHQESA